MRTVSAPHSRGAASPIPGVNASNFGYPTWSKDSRLVYGAISPPDRLVGLAVATRRVEEIRSIKEFRLTGSFGTGAPWTPDGKPVVLTGSVDTRHLPH